VLPRRGCPPPCMRAVRKPNSCRKVGDLVDGGAPPYQPVNSPIQSAVHQTLRCLRHADENHSLLRHVRRHSKRMAFDKRRTPSTWDLWGVREDAVPFSGDPDEVALIARMTGKSPIQVRLAIMKVGPDRDAVLAELKKTTP
jgi:hypothetical protein